MRLTLTQSLMSRQSKRHETSTLRAFMLVVTTFVVAVTVVLYSILGMMSLLMFLFPWAP